MPEDTPRMGTLFPCALAEPFLERLPELPPRSGDAWTRRYRVLTVGMKAMGSAGALVLRRRPDADGGVLLGVDYDRSVVARHVCAVRVEMVFGREDPVTPLRWSLHSVTRDPDGNPDPLTEYAQDAEVTADHVAITAHGRTRRIPRRGLPAIPNWGLFASPGAWPGPGSAERPILLLDDMDQPKPARLACAGKQRVLLGAQRLVSEREIPLERGRVWRPEWVWKGGRAAELTRYHLTGDGVVPYVFYTDPAARVLFAGAGTEAYALEAESPSAEG
ncbi:MAG: hypothetical protein JXR77_02970 [Lentisphaeria bacterium]|nr:hypothetical protein [Lentisphaeria bacterium]